jgi:hypothetical protein
VTRPLRVHLRIGGQVPDVPEDCPSGAYYVVPGRRKTEMILAQGFFVSKMIEKRSGASVRTVTLNAEPPVTGR